MNHTVEFYFRYDIDIKEKDDNYNQDSQDRTDNGNSKDHNQTDLEDDRNESKLGTIMKT
jgi:hypothetical protein